MTDVRCLGMFMKYQKLYYMNDQKLGLSSTPLEIRYNHLWTSIDTVGEIRLVIDNENMFDVITYI